jgi:spore germination protein YaaH
MSLEGVRPAGASAGGSNRMFLLRSTRLLIAMLAFVALLVLALSTGWGTQAGKGARALASAHTSSGLAVTGYQQQEDAPAFIDRSAAALDTVGVDAVNLNSSGSQVSRVGASALRQLARSHADHLHATLLIANWDNNINDFSEPIAHRLLGSPAHIKSVARRLVSEVKAAGFDGVAVDIESLMPRDTRGLVSFVKLVRRLLPARDQVSVDVSNSTSASDYRAAGYDLRALGRAANVIALMAYDEHGPWEKTPGPIGELSWQRAGLSALLEQVPAAKVDLGVAGYGYAWRNHHPTVTVSDAQARKLVADDRASARFDAYAGEWTATLSDGSTLWWSDGRSYPLRVTLARSLHLHGMAVWALGLSDPLA